MLGLMFIVGIGGLVLLVALAMWGAGRISLKAGQSATAARRWKYGVLAAVLLSIFWDWLPTWIAYEYYSRQADLDAINGHSDSTPLPGINTDNEVLFSGDANDRLLTAPEHWTRLSQAAGNDSQWEIAA